MRTFRGECVNHAPVRKANRPTLRNLWVENALFEGAPVLFTLMLVGAGAEGADICWHGCIEGVLFLFGC